MSRSCPWKLKPHKAKFTILAFGEGQTEEAFLKHLGYLYITRDSGISITYDYAGGKDPAYMIDRVIRKKRGYGAFDLSFILLDSDKVILTETKEKADTYNIIIIQSTPCVEGLLLATLDQNFNCSGKNSEQCKKEFENNYLNKKDKTNNKKYCGIITKKNLDSVRNKIKTIDDLLRIFKNEK